MKFSENDADEWFSRNEEALSNLNDVANDRVISTVTKYIKHGMDVLEIGCANGARLHAFQKLIKANFFGVDLSTRAIETGQTQFSTLNLSVQNANSLDFQSERFDLVILGFFLYLVDREEYEQTISEAIRVLRKEGFIAILDFDVPRAYSNVYAHNSALNSHKCDNAQIFLRSGEFTLVEKIMFSHSEASFVKDIDERLSLQILYREPESLIQKVTSNA